MIREKNNTADDLTSAIEKKIRELAPGYLRNRDSEFRCLQLQSFQIERNRLETLGHRLKGNAKSYGFEPLGALGAKLEIAAHDGDESASTELVKEIVEFLAEAQGPAHRPEK